MVEGAWKEKRMVVGLDDFRVLDANRCSWKENLF